MENGSNKMKLTLDDLLRKENTCKKLLASKKIICSRYRVNASLSVDTNIVTNKVVFIIEDFENEKTIHEDRISLAVEAYNKIGGE